MSRNFWRGEKVQLRAVEEHDLETLLSPEEDTEVDRYDDFIRFPSTKEQGRKFFEEIAKRDGKNDTFFWLIKDLEGRHVGSIGTFDCDRRVGAFKYGLRILHPFWRRGYAREAITTVLRYYFHELRYQKATAIVYAFNERSQRLHESLGFTLEGRLRRMVYTNGRHYDELYFGLIREEFDERAPYKALVFSPLFSKAPTTKARICDMLFRLVWTRLTQTGAGCPTAEGAL